MSQSSHPCHWLKMKLDAPPPCYSYLPCPLSFVVPWSSFNHLQKQRVRLSVQFVPSTIITKGPHSQARGSNTEHHFSVDRWHGSQPCHRVEKLRQSYLLPIPRSNSTRAYTISHMPHADISSRMSMVLCDFWGFMRLHAATWPRRGEM